VCTLVLKVTKNLSSLFCEMRVRPEKLLLVGEEIFLQLFGGFSRSFRHSPYQGRGEDKPDGQ